MRARLAPRQKWGPPPPKAMWGLGSRPMSKVSGSVEDVLVPVGRGVEEDDLVAGRDLGVAELEVDHGGAAEVHDGGDEAEHLVDGGGQEGAVGQQALPLLGVLEEGVHGARHEVAGRLVAGHGEEEEEQLELELAQLLAVDLDRGEHAHEVGVGVDPLLAEELGGVGVELHGGDHGLLGLALVLGVLVAHHAVGPLEHAVAVLLGDAEQLGDDLEGQLGGEVGDEVGLALSR